MTYPIKRRKTNFWSGEDARKLFNMHKDGATMDELYEAFPNRTQDAIDTRCHRMGLSVIKKRK